jgi:hypothetical protein
LSIQVVFLCCTGAVLSQCNKKKTTWINKTALVQHKKDNLDRQNNTSAT